MADQSGDRISSATAQIQATAKWIITAFAGVGAALIAGLQLTGLGKLAFPEILIPVGGLLIALSAVFYAIREVAKVLTPPMIVLDELKDWVGELTEKDETLLMGRADDLEQLLERYVATDSEVRAEWDAVEQAKLAKNEAAAATAKVAAEAKDEAFKPLNQAVNFLRRLAINMKVRKAFEDMWWPLAGAVTPAVAGGALLAYRWTSP